MRLPIITGFLAIVILTSSNAQHQTFKQRTQITVAVSTTDAGNFGARYRINQSQLWCNIGLSAMGRQSHFITIGPGFSQHLWGDSKHTDLKPWYLKVALTGVSYALPYTRLTTERARMIYTKIHIGRDFNISKRLGITFSMGPSARVYRKWNRPEERYSKIDLINLASFDFGGYYRLQKLP